MTQNATFENPDSWLWKEMHWQPSSKQLNQFVALQAQLAHWNTQVNLTRLTKGEDFWISQIFDSLWPLQKELKNPEEPRNFIDIGTGCGFPGLAIAIAIPGAKITLVDAIKKKTNALAQITSSLELTSRISLRTERAELTGQHIDLRGMFDIAMARAVASAPVVAEYLIPLIKAEGEALLFKGKWNRSDEKKLIKALKPLQARIKQIDSIQLPASRGIRHLIRLEKELECPSLYPRAIGIPKKRPLGT